MKRAAILLIAALVGGEGLAHAQGADVNKILADARAALGGDKKLSAVKTFAATGQSTRVIGESSSPQADFAMAFELPDKFMKKEVLTTMGNFAVTRTSGFNGDNPIEVIDRPPNLPGNVVIRMGGPGSAPPGTTPTPEQQEAERKAKMMSGRQEFARLALGLLAASPAAYPLEFSYVGQAESPDGKADVIGVKGEGGFEAQLFIDSKTHLPLMLSWMAKEPLVITRTVGGRGEAGAGPGGNTSISTGGGHVTAAAPGAPKTQEEIEKMKKQAEDEVKAAEARLRVVEYRLYYGNYRDVDGVKVPFTLQRSIDGKPNEEVTFDKVKINTKIDPKTFEAK